MTAMMRTTAWPASIVVMMMASGEITRRGGIKQESDVPGQKFLEEMAKRGIRIERQVK
jgi:lysine 6-dehydrogenase